MNKEYQYKCRTVFVGKDGMRHDIKAKSYRELEEKKKKLEAKIDEQLKNNSVNNITPDSPLSEWIEYCIETYKTRQSAITRRKYISRVRSCITKYIGDNPIKSVKPIDIQDTLNKQQNKSKTQVNEVYQALKLIFKNAVINGLIDKDPSIGLSKPVTAKRQGRRALTTKEREAVIAVGKTNRRYYFYLLMLLCGCRPSEAAECQGKDIRIKDGYPVLHIRGVKTKNADRLVPMPDELYDLIKDTPPLEFIATTGIIEDKDTGIKIGGNKITNYSRIWKAFKRELNLYMGCKKYRNRLVPPYPLAPDLVPYCFRHEFCTQLARKGVDIREAQRLMGHSNISLTADIYTNYDQGEVAISVAAKLYGDKKEDVSGK